MQNNHDEAIAFLRSGLPGDEKPAKLRKHVTAELPGLLDEFYAGLLKSPAASMFSDPNRVPGLKAAQRAHWESLFADAVDDRTRAQSRRIGETHERIRLPSAWYISAYGYVLMKLVPSVTRHYGFHRGDLDAVLCTLVNRLFGDMAASLSAHEHATVERAVRDQKDRNTDTLGKLAASVAELNSVILKLAFLQRNSNDVAVNGQTISSAAAELVASVEEISRNSESASSEAEETNQSASSGRQAIDKLAGTIANIAAAVDETSGNVRELSDSSDRIGQILSDIEGIAAQTNLLALNATIESARAGEAGKGFAVVAAEVKTLADQTARSTEDIARRIAALREGMAAINDTMQTSTSAVTEGEEAIGSASSRIGQIADQVGKVSTRMLEISGILNQQQGASSEIAASIDNVAATAAESDRMVQEISAIIHRSTTKFLENATEMFDTGSDVALCYMAKIDHIMFKQRVIDTCMGDDDWKSGEVPDHHNCRLGKWYDGISDPAIRALPAFTALVEPHKVVHASAKAALDAAAVNDLDAMTKNLKQLDDASVQVLGGLEDLSVAIRKTRGRADAA